jgi:hypothetical protein
LSRKLMFHLNLTKLTDTLHEDQYTYMRTSTLHYDEYMRTNTLHDDRYMRTNTLHDDRYMRTNSLHEDQYFTWGPIHQDQYFTWGPIHIFIISRLFFFRMRNVSDKSFN